MPGVFALANVLSRRECRQFVAAAQGVGYTPDQPVNRSSSSSATRAETVAWLVDDSITDVIMRRCLPHLPVLDGEAAVGLNARWRFYAYRPPAVYGPHIDGAWPGSAIKDGKLAYDGYGDRWSRLTFLLYLNDDFSGGGTTYFLPDENTGTLHARSTSPRAGCVVCFPHGSDAGALVHEGSLVTRGRKYIVRTDVLYPLADRPDSRKLFSRHLAVNKEQDDLRAVPLDDV